MAARKPCSFTGCRNLTSGQYCETHSYRRRERERQRPSAAERGYDSAWRTYSKRRLVLHPWCADPDRMHPMPVLATCTDHVTPHRGDRKLLWEKSNHQSLCDACHSRKTARDDGGFGNARNECEG